MSTGSTKAIRGVLDPVDRVSEVLFGVIMVLTFTCSISAGTAGREEVREMLIGAVACNLAWGFVDAVMYLVSTLTERGRALVAFRSVRDAVSREAAHDVIASSMPPLVASQMAPQELEALRLRLAALPEPPPRPRLDREDWLGAVAVFLLVFLSTFPVVLPFVFVEDAGHALRLSNGVAIVMMFLGGYGLGRQAGAHPWRTGLAMVAVGVVLVGLTIALGG
jgi:VIT1/CCC1 family predicted Fe2+/Mn2+ transporter